MTRNSGEMAFYVVQFLELPYEGIDDYVCVPHTWIIIHRRQDGRSVIAYPEDKDPSVTRDRAKRKERYSNEWKFYVATVKYQSNSYQNAEYWIASRSNHRPLVERITDNLVERETRKMPGTQPESNTNPRNFTQGHSSKLKDNLRKQLPRILIKRPAVLKPNKQLDGKRLKLNETAQSSSASVADANTESKREQPTSIHDNQSTKLAHIQKSTVVSNINLRTEQSPQIQRPEQNKEAPSLPVIGVDGPSEVMEIDGRHHSQGIKTSNQSNRTSHSHLSNSTATVSMSAAKSLTSTERTNQPNQYNNQEHILGSRISLSNSKIQLENVRSHANADNAHCKLRGHEVSSNIQTTSHKVINSVKRPAQLCDNVYQIEDLVQVRNAIEKKIRLRNMKRNMKITAQNSSQNLSQPNEQDLQRQPLVDNFANLFTQMGSTLRYTCDMYNTLRGSILDTAITYKKLMGAVEEFNSAQNSAGNESFSINLKPEVRQSPEERQTEVTVSTSSGTQNQQSNDDANKPPKKKHNSWRFVLPPEYDPHDTKWTLKYRTNLPGLVELMPQSGVYISYGDLIYCQRVSKDCKSLACRLLQAVFNQKALSVCLTITEKARASDNVGPDRRPELDNHACTVLLHFVLKLGVQRDWNTDLQPILSTLHSKIQEMRFKYGEMIEC